MSYGVQRKEGPTASFSTPSAILWMILPTMLRWFPLGLSLRNRIMRQREWSTSQWTSTIRSSICSPLCLRLRLWWITHTYDGELRERRTVPTPRPRHTSHRTAHNSEGIHPRSIHATKTKVWHENQALLNHAEVVGSVERAWNQPNFPKAVSTSVFVKNQLE